MAIATVLIENESKPIRFDFSFFHWFKCDELRYFMVYGLFETEIQLKYQKTVRIFNFIIFSLIILSNRTSNIKDGTIKMNGRDRNISQFRKLSAYIMQDNQLHGNLTVEEAMTVATNLKLSAKVPKNEKNVVVSVWNKWGEKRNRLNFIWRQIAFKLKCFFLHFIE